MRKLSNWYAFLILVIYLVLFFRLGIGLTEEAPPGVYRAQETLCGNGGEIWYVEAWTDVNSQSNTCNINYYDCSGKTFCENDIGLVIIRDDGSCIDVYVTPDRGVLMSRGQNANCYPAPSCDYQYTVDEYLALPYLASCADRYNYEPPCPDSDDDGIPDGDDCYPDDSNKSGKLAIEYFYCDANGIRVGADLVDECGKEYVIGNTSWDGVNVFLNIVMNEKFEYNKVPGEDCQIAFGGTIVGVPCFADMDPGDSDTPPDYQPSDNASCIPNTMISCGCGGAQLCDESGQWGPCIGSDCDKDGIPTPNDRDDANDTITTPPSTMPPDSGNPTPGEDYNGTTDIPAPDGPDSGGGGNSTIIINNGNGTASGNLTWGNPEWELPGGNDYSEVLNIEKPEKRDIKKNILSKLNGLRKFKLDLSLSGGYCSFQIDVFGQTKSVDWCWMETALQLIGNVAVGLSALYAIFIMVGRG